MTKSTKRGWDSLMSGLEIEQSEKISSIKLSEIVLSPSQPRRYFDQKAIDDLASSIEKQGFKSVIVVRPKNGKFEIVAGERRYHAAMKANLSEVPCLSEELTDEEAYQYALDENLKREDLSKLEEITGILDFITLKYKIPQEQIIDIVQTEGHHRNQSGGNVSTSIELKNIQQVLTSYNIKLETFRTRYLPLLKLPEELKDAHLQGKLSYNHVIEIDRVKDTELRRKILDEAVNNKLSVRKVKERIRAASKSSKQSVRKPKSDTPPQAVLKRWKQLQSADVWTGENIEKMLAVMEEVLGIRDHL
ncbi:MAG: ParB/RepB/Spo0J family partition protein [Cyanobacteria bacterium J06649_11]